MSDYRPADLPLPPDDFDGSRSSPTLSPADAAVIGGLAHPLSMPPPGEGQTPRAVSAPPLTAGPAVAAAAPAAPPSDGRPLKNGQVLLNKSTLRRLRESRLLSQQELIYDFQRHNVSISIATIKRAETGHAVRYRIARNLAEYFGVSFDHLLH